MAHFTAVNLDHQPLDMRAEGPLKSSHAIDQGWVSVVPGFFVWIANR